MIRTQSVSTIALTVADVDRTTSFYTQAFGCIVLFDHVFESDSYSQLGQIAPSSVRMVTLRLGNEYIELIQYLDLESAPVPADSQSHDLWFQHMAIVVSDMELAYRHLQSFEIEPISLGPQTIPLENSAAGGVRAFKFRDVDRHSLELIWFPPDKRRTKWNNPGERLYLGIDHSAISISDTAQSLSFYQDILGLEVVNHSNNKGPTQAALDGLPRADVKITSLQTSQTKIGIELLDYLQPEDSRARSKFWQINDLPHRHLVLEVENIHNSLDILRQHNIEIVSPYMIRLPDKYRYTQGVLIKDPDGHSLLLVSTP
ncbi:MAG: VOC family protein [Cyanobacteria bacterium P01_H01_bin.21]